MTKKNFKNTVEEKAFVFSIVVALTMVCMPVWAQQNNADIEDVKAKATDAMNKAKEKADKSEVKSVEDAKKLASEKYTKGKEELGKKWNKLKEDNAAKNANSSDGDKDEKVNNGQAKGKADEKPGKRLAKGQENAPGKQLSQGEEEAADTDSDSASAAAAEVERQNLLRRREMGYMMHRRYLDSNEPHLKTMMKVSMKKGLKVTEQRKHIKRIARIQRLLELAEDKEDAQTIDRIEKMREREIARHEKALVQLHKRAKQGE